MIISELCEGGSLQSFLERTKGPLPANLRDKFAKQICEGVQSFHDKNIVHRDLKPGNILVTKEEDIKITDFGLVIDLNRTASAQGGDRQMRGTRCRRESGYVSMCTLASAGAGTRLYMAPEAFALNAENLTTKADIWALGIIILELHGVSLLVLFQQLIRLRQAPDIPDSVPLQAKEVIKKCSSLEPNDRPTAGQLLKVLTGTSTPPPKPVSPSAPASRPASPQPSNIKHADEYEVVEASFKAAKKGECAALTQMIKTHGVAILDKRNDHGDTPFLAAASRGQAGAMPLMYDAYGPSILKQTYKNGRTAMHWAAANGHVAAVNKLLEWDLTLLDACDKTGTTPFITARYHVDVLKALYAKGQDKQNMLTHQTNLRDTVLHDAVKASKGDSVAQLLEWGVEAGVNLLDIKGYEGKTPWDLASEKPGMRKVMEKYKQ